MPPTEFRYRLSDKGRIVLGQLTSEETLEFEVLSLKERDGTTDLQSELRLLDLYVKYNGPMSRPRHEWQRTTTASPTSGRVRRKTTSRRLLPRPIAMMLIITLMCAGLATLVFLAQ
jgi:hypothetical protein